MCPTIHEEDLPGGQRETSAVPELPPPLNTLRTRSITLTFDCCRHGSLFRFESYFSGSCGEAPPSAVRQFIENQRYSVRSD